MPDWLVGICQGNGQRKLRARLNDAGIQTYFPEIKQRRVWHGRVSWRLSFMLGRYFFAVLDSRWRNLFAFEGVAQVLTYVNPKIQDYEPYKVSDAAIEKIRQVEAQSISVPVSRFKSGQPLRIIEGAMTGFEAVYEGPGARDRELVLVDVLGRKVRLELDTMQLESGLPR